MNKKQTLILGLMLSIAITVNWCGEYLIQQKFHQNSESVKPNPESQLISPISQRSIASLLKDKHSSTAPSETIKSYVELVSSENEEESKEEEILPGDDLKINLDQPEILKSDIQAAPINTNNLNLLKELIKKEIPDSSKEEQEAWLEELKDMPLKMSQDLLMMRKKMGIPSLTSELFNTQDETAELPNNNEVPHEITLTQPGTPDLKYQTFIHNSVKSLDYATKIILNNIANANTTGFKRMEPMMATLPYHLKYTPGSATNSGSTTPNSLSTGTGVSISGSHTDFSLGELRKTNQALDLAISGEGFFPVTDGSHIYYTRCGRLTVNSDGNIVMAHSQRGLLLDPNICIPQNTTSISISVAGIVTVTQAGSLTVTEVGQIQLNRFPNPNGLIPIEDNLYSETTASGAPLTGNPNEDGLGKIMQKYLEASNVNLEDEKLHLRQIKQTLTALKEASSILSPEFPESFSQEYIAPESANLPIYEFRR